jgi:arylsulfatase A-like enzyme
VSTVDLAPTLLELAGSRISDGIQGRSFLDLLTRPDSFAGPA